jgi:ribosomal protein S18 acetylase RimI-like enzyme
VIEYTTSLDGVAPPDLDGLSVGWPSPPSRERHLDLLHGSAHVVLAREVDRVIGFVTAISDGVLSVYIPLLEVLPEFQGRGIGSELVRRLLDRLEGLYMVDVVCDEDVVPFYVRFGLQRFDAALGRRDRSRL